MSSEIEIEPIPGLPHDLPPGEEILWQGRPQWKAMARQTFKVRWIAAYFAVFATARFLAAMKEGLPGALHLLIVAALALVCLAVLCLFAWAYARATVYTITTRRVVMRIGVALPTTWNLPFKRLASADLALRTELDGDIALQLKAPDRIAWLQLWPHVAPWQFVRARPSLRNIVEPERVAMLLADAVQAWAATESAPVLVTALEPSAPVVTVVSPAPAEVGLNMPRELVSRLNADVATEVGR
jgi:hypothetical protein